MIRMMRPLVALLLAVATTFSLPERGYAQSKASEPLTTAQIFAKTKDAVVTIQSGSKTGSGFFVGDWLFTCFHVVSGSDSIRFSNRYGVQGSCRGAITLNAELDLAVFYAGESAPKRNGVGFGDYAALETGSKLVVVGSPLGLEGTVTEGIASSKRMEGGFSILQLSAGISPGSSGSPVFNSYGEVVGMVTSKLKAGEQLNFAVGGNDLKTNWLSGTDLSMIAGTGQKTSSPVFDWKQDDRRAWLVSAKQWFARANDCFRDMRSELWTPTDARSDANRNLVSAYKKGIELDRKTAKDNLTYIDVLLSQPEDVKLVQIFRLYQDLLNLSETLIEAWEYDLEGDIEQKLGRSLRDRCTELRSSSYEIKHSAYAGLLTALGG